MDRDTEIINVRGHYECYIDGVFVGSEDTYLLASQLIDEELNNGER